MPKRSRSRSRRDPAAAALDLWINRWFFVTLVLAGALWWYDALRWLTLLGALSLSALLLKRWTYHTERDRQELALRLGSFHDDPDPGRFEERTVLLLRELGWTDVRRTGQTGDGGVDVRGCKDGQPWIVQCKRYAATNTIGEPLIREFYGTLIHEGAAGGLFVTSSSYTAQAQRWATGKPIVLWDAEKLGQEIARTAPDAAAIRQKERQRWMYRASALVTLTACAILCCIFLPTVSVPTFHLGTQATHVVSATATPARSVAVATVAPAATTLPNIQATIVQDGNLRAQPEMSGTVIQVVRGRAQVQILGRSANSAWLYTQTSDGIRGWVHRSLLEIDADVVLQLPVHS